MPLDNPQKSAPKSVQRGVITIPNSTGTVTATIAAVNTAKSELSWCGTNGNSDQNSSSNARLSLSNSTTVEALRTGVTTNTISVSYEVTEWN